MATSDKPASKSPVRMSLWTSLAGGAGDGRGVDGSKNWRGVRRAFAGWKTGLCSSLTCGESEMDGKRGFAYLPLIALNYWM